MPYFSNVSSIRHLRIYDFTDFNTCIFLLLLTGLSHLEQVFNVTMMIWATYVYIITYVYIHINALLRADQSKKFGLCELYETIISSNET